jgi:uncharacterized protein YjbI with pentapeptide repeats
LEQDAGHRRVATEEQGEAVERELVVKWLLQGPEGVARWNAQRGPEPPRLDRADLRSTDLRGADLRGVRLFRANLAGANLREANLEGANLSEADLTGADLTSARLTSAKLFRGILERAVLADAHLEGAYLGEAELDGADLCGADLSAATGLTIMQLRKTKRNGRTRLPPSLAVELDDANADGEPPNEV